MVVKFSKSGLQQTAWYEYVIRFVLGGAVTVIAAILSRKVSPEFGGLFLAFPAILAASVTLVEKHERERKLQRRITGKHLGHRAAGSDAAGAAMGSIGLMSFACFVWKFLPESNGLTVIGGATLLWALVCLAIWWAWKRNLLHRVRERVAGSLRVHHG